jgi:cytochrome c-type biogenesis protein
MGDILGTLSRWVEGGSSVALLASLLWGILSVLLSPCHLASIPLIVGYVGGTPGATPRRSFGVSSLFALGVLGSIALLGVVTAAMGRLLGDVGGWANWMAAGIFFAMGLHLLEVITLPFGGPSGIGTGRKGFLAAALVGFVYGVALGPCTFAYMAPVLTVGFRLGATSPLFAFLLFAAFGLGHCAVIVAAGSSAGLVQRYLSWSAGSRAPVVLRKVCGVLVLAGGLYFIWTAR